MGAVFLGTPAAAIASLAAVADIEDVDMVITKPDRPGSRGGRPIPPPVKTAAKQFGFRVAQPETAAELLEILSDGSFAFGVVVAYGSILTPKMIKSAPSGFLNVHFSLLPRWRGAAPVERAILAGDTRTGVTLMKIDEGLDTGDVVAEVPTPIGPRETGGSLTARLSFLGAMLLDDTLPEFLAGRRVPVPQIASAASHAKRLTKEEAQLTSSLGKAQAERTIRAFLPRPVAWLATDRGRLQIHGAQPSDSAPKPGTVTLAESGVVAGFSDGGVELNTVRPEGRSLLSADEWFRGTQGRDVTFD